MVKLPGDPGILVNDASLDVNIRVESSALGYEGSFPS